MKVTDYLIIILVLLLILASTCFVINYLNSTDQIKCLNGHLQKAFTDRHDALKQLQSATNIYANPPDKIDVSAKAGLTEMPGWQFQKILERGGNGSIFYQLSAATSQYTSSISTAGPIGYSWQSTTNDALQAAKSRRGEKSK